MRRMVCALFSGFALFLLLLTGARAEDTPVLRALLVSCDHFVSQVDTSPAAETNVNILADALQSDSRGYAVIRKESGTIATVDALRRAVRETFSGAKAGDISFFYISTHGLYNVSRSNMTAGLLLSDGQNEELADAQTLATRARSSARGCPTRRSARRFRPGSIRCCAAPAEARKAGTGKAGKAPLRAARAILPRSCPTA